MASRRNQEKIKKYNLNDAIKTLSIPLPLTLTEEELHSIALLRNEKRKAWIDYWIPFLLLNNEEIRTLANELQDSKLLWKQDKLLLPYTVHGKSKYSIQNYLF